MNVLFLVPYPTEGPSNRYRVEQYLPYLRAAGVKATVHSFIRPASFYRLLYQPGQVWRKGLYFGFSAASRLLDVARVSRYDLIFVHREAFPFGPPLLEWLLARLGCPLVYDFDDAIYLPNSSQANRWLGFLKMPGKTAHIISYSRRVIAGNNYLGDYARRYNPQVTIIPTPVDTDLYTVRPYPGAGGPEVTIGWMGSTTTGHYLHLLDEVFRRLAGQYQIVIKVIGGRYHLPGVEVVNQPWTLEREVADLQSF
ncbi:MAG: glycosyltransferase, partial [Chloroflexota bacterium]